MGDDTRDIRHEIEQTRALLGDTVEALAYKADVPARAKDALNERIETVKEAVSDAAATVHSTARDVAGKAKDLLHRNDAGNATPGRELPEDD